MFCFKLLLNPIYDILQLIFCHIFCISVILCYYNLVIHPILFKYAFWFIPLFILDKFNYALNRVIIKDERNYVQPNPYKAYLYHNTRPSIIQTQAFRSVVSDLLPPYDWRKGSKCPQWVPMQAVQETDILGLLSSTLSDWGCLTRLPTQHFVRGGSAC
jgi:hypothetical protein